MIVWVSTSARSSGVSGPGLLMISFGIRILPDVVQQRHELGVAPGARVEPEFVRDRYRQRDDVAAVRAGVAVVRLDHVAEQERGAAVGVAELERVVDACFSLARERAEEGDERQHEQDGRGVIGGSESGQVPDRRQRRIDDPCDREVADEDARRDPEGDPRVRRGVHEVEGELRREREQQEPRGRLVGGGHSCGGEHEHGAERVRRLAEPAEHPLQPDLPLRELDDVAEHHARGDAERHQLERQQEEHRHEDELRCDGQARADLELDVVGERVRADEHEHEERRCVRGRIAEEHHHRGDREEHAAVGCARPELAAPEPRATPRPAVLDQPFRNRIELDRAHDLGYRIRLQDAFTRTRDSVS